MKKQFYGVLLRDQPYSKTLFLSLLVMLCTSLWTCRPKVVQHTIDHEFQQKIHGLSFVAPPTPFSHDPMAEVCATHADWIAVIPYAYTLPGKNRVHHNQNDWQWWGECPEGVATTIRLAHQAGLRVMLKPQLYVPGGWTGDLTFSQEADWQTWATDYEKYILAYAEMADSMQVALFCIGTEFKKLVQEHPTYWRTLISKIKKRYRGPLTYAANWDAYTDVPFWDALDYVGINAYFPLTRQTTPSFNTLKNAWQPHLEAIGALAYRVQKPVLFTEFGYLSVDACAYNTWELEANIQQCAINETAQARAIEGLFRAFWEQPYWVGGFLWKWFPNNEGHEGYFDKDYTPQGKEASQVLKKWYAMYGK